MSDGIEPLASELELGAVFAAVSDPLRRRVVHELARGLDGEERSCASFGLPVSKSTRSHHFRVLREAGLVEQVDHGNFSGVTLRRADLESRFPGLLDLIASEKSGARHAE